MVMHQVQAKLPRLAQHATDLHKQRDDFGLQRIGVAAGGRPLIEPVGADRLIPPIA
jgi:hypothetical protein